MPQRKITSIDKAMKKLEFLPITNGNISDATAVEKSGVAFKNLNIESPHDSAFLLLIIYPKYLRVERQVGICTLMSIIPLPTMSKMKWMNEHTNTHTQTQFSFKKEIAKPDGGGTRL